jgi:hypothetical protein
MIDIVHKKIENKPKKIENDSKELKKKGNHLRNYTKEIIFAKI